MKSYKTKPSTMRKMALLSAIAAGSVGYAASSSAQVNVSDENVDLLSEEIIVTARKIQESQQDVPVAITTHTAENLEIHNVEQLADIGNLTPGLSLSAGVGTTTTMNVAIRGQSEVESQLVLDPAVGVYVDGIYLSRSQALGVNLYDLQQVEVLKGPQGTLFGRNTTGGAVNITTADPGEEFEGKVKVTLGNYDRRNFQGAVSIPITDDVGFRIAANLQRRDGFVDNAINGDELEDEDSNSYRLKFLATPGDWTIRFNADYAEAFNAPIANRATPITDCNPFAGFGVQAVFNPNCGTAANIAFITSLYGPYDALNPPVNPTDPGFFAFLAGAPAATGLLVGGVLPPNLTNIAGAIEGFVTGTIAGVLASNAAGLDDPYTVFHNTTGKTEVRDKGASFTIAHDFESLEIKSITAYREIDTLRFWDSDATPLPLLDVDGGVDQEQVSQELQFNGSALEDRLTYSTGIYYFKEEGTDIVDQDIGGLTSVTTLINDAENKSLGAYFQGSYDITDALAANLGFRRTKDEREVTVRHQALSAAGNTIPFCDLDDPLLNAFGDAPGVCAATVDSTFYGTSFLAGLDYKVSEDKLVYFVYREGFRSGGFSGRAGTLAQLNAVPPEELTDYELGFKGDWYLFGVAARTNIAVYFSEIDNRQRSFTRATPTGGLTTIIESAAEGEVFGFEAELLLYLTENLVFNAGLSHTDAEHTTFIDSEGVDRSNEPVPQSPEYAFNAGFTYQQAIEQGGEGVVTLDYNWLDEQSFGFNPDPTVTSDSYGLLNFRAGWTDIAGSGASAHIWIRNVTDEEYIVGGVFLFSNFGYSTNNYGEPRTFGIDISYDF